MKKKSIVIGLAAIVACGGGTYAYLANANTQTKSQAAVQESTVKVTKGSIRSVISGTAQLEPKEQQMIVPPKEGVIKTLNLTRSQTVKKGDLLLELTDTSLNEKLEQARVTLSTQQSDLQDLQSQLGSMTVKAPISGNLTLSTNISEGASVSKTTKVATIGNPDVLTVTLPFVQEQVASVTAGELVQLTVDGYLLTKSGVVESISASGKSDAQGNRLADVKIRGDNDGTLDAAQKVSGTLTAGGLSVESTGQAALQYKNSATVMAGASGNIDKLEILENRAVKAGEVIATIVNDTLEKDITAKQLQIDQSVSSIASMERQLEELKVYAPFDGVFSTDFADQKKNVLNSYPVGTTIASNVQLGAVASLDTLQLPIKVDELDLPKIKNGQKAEVKVDAAPGKTFTGEVTQVSTVGTTTNGVTFYTAVLSLNSAPELKYSMTATADIIIEDKKDVLVLPVAAVKERGGKKVVTVKAADGTVKTQEVKTGANSATMVEITEGVQEGDTIVLQAAIDRSKMTQQEIDQMRSQFQQGTRGGTTGGTGTGGAGGNGGFGGPPPGGF